MVKARSLKLMLPSTGARERHDDIPDQGADDLAEGGADHDTDRQVDDVALHGKFFEFRRQDSWAILR